MESKLGELSAEVCALKTKCNDLEGRQRRHNLRILGIPEGDEGSRPTEFIAQLLQDMLELEEKPLLDGAHRSLRPKPKRGKPLRAFVIRVHYYHVHDQIHRRAAEASPLSHKGSRLSIFPDFTAEVAKKRAAFVSAQQFFNVLQSPSLSHPILPPHASWGDIMDALDDGLEGVEPFMLHAPWSADNISQEEEQKLMEHKLQEHRQTQACNIITLLFPFLSQSEDVQAGSINAPLAPPVTSPAVSEPEPGSATHVQPQPSVEKQDRFKAPPSTLPDPLSWGDIMDALDNGLEDIEPFTLHHPWRMNVIDKVEEQKLEEQQGEEQKEEEQNAEEQQVQAKIQKQPVQKKKVPEKCISKNKKTFTLLLRNLDGSVEDERLQEEFRRFGTVINAKVMMKNGRSSGKGFITFTSRDEARKAIVSMNGRLLGSKPVYVSPAQSSRTRQLTIQPQDAAPERQEEPRREKKMPEKTISRVQAKTGEIFVKNLDYSVDDEFLHDYFQPFGSVIRAKVIMENGRSRGRGFVQYTTPDEARNAVEMLNGKILGGRPLHVAINNEQHKTTFAWTQRVQQHRRPCVAPAAK
ncbi:uncharacterized protein LOC132873812 [Neoarius graeffei]|uniref:uncharacterized protein LOC132873812 n=1 Tax=Neoarius graeffei TaxID=443677 RepID=UPI00298BF760|nr:uncharacterized protein LOC132873812 [Neoarius graeffei]